MEEVAAYLMDQNILASRRREPGSRLAVEATPDSQRPVRQLVARNHLALHARLVDPHRADHAAGGAVARHRVAERFCDELFALLLVHARPVVGVAKAVDVGGARAADGEWSRQEATSHRDGEDLPALLLVPAGDDDARGQRVLVVVAQLVEDVGSRLDLGRLSVLHPVLVQVVRHVVRHGLRVRRRSRPANVDPLVHPGDLVGHAVGDVDACIAKGHGVGVGG
eukprot:scaffold90374_cov60-Phaeocystis_antarctica.AAC.3